MSGSSPHEPGTSATLGERPPAFRRSLIRNLVLLMVVTAGAILAVAMRAAHQAVVRLSHSVIDSAAESTRTRLDQFFGAVDRNLLVARDWGRAGLLDPTEPRRLNELFIPVLERNPQVSSLLVAHEGGQEYLLLRDGDGWLNRLTRAEEWGSRTHWLRWADAQNLLEEWDKELDYDPRRRPWYKGAMTSMGEAPHWTAPYIFFTTRDPGITASIKWRRADDPTGPTHVVAFDVMLIDISAFSSGLEVSPRGQAVVLTEDGTVLGLPRDERYPDVASRKEAVLLPAEQLGLPALSAAVSARRERAGSEVRFRFETETGRWWAGFRTFSLSPERSLDIGVLVPEADLLGQVRGQRNLVIAIAAAALAVASLMAVLLDRAWRSRMKHALAQVQRIGQYTLEKPIGSGGMGTIYRARHALLRRPTAIKLLRPEQSRNEEALARFELEVQLTSRLTHPNTIAIYDYGRTPEGLFYYVMEYLSGVNLHQLLPHSGPLSPARTIYILQQVCGSLEEAHGIGLIHRDIKPANIMLCERGGRHDVVKLMDFGLVKDIEAGEDVNLTQEDRVAGTPLYMSPESIRTPEKVDARSDLYALGAIGYFLLTGKPVFEGENVVDVCAQHMNATPVPPSERLGATLAKDLEAVVLACLEKDPARRPQSAAELSRRLAACADWRRWGSREARTWWQQRDGLKGEPSDEPSTSAAAPATIQVDLRARAGPRRAGS